MKCIVCNSENLSEIYQNSNLGFLKCLDCDVLFKKDMPSISELTKIYNDFYIKDNNELVSVSMETNKRVLTNYAKYIFDTIEETGSLLDVGCGTGILLSELAVLNGDINLEGLEFDDNARSVASKSFKIYENFNDINVQYDAISMIEVIEHITDPVDFMTSTYRNLKDNGTLFITTPNINSLKSRVEKERYSEINKPFHLVLFSECSLRCLLLNSGFRDIQFIRFAPFSTKNVFEEAKMRLLQALNLYGGLFVVARK